jgi:hypothetical protein
MEERETKVAGEVEAQGKGPEGQARAVPALQVYQPPAAEVLAAYEEALGACTTNFRKESPVRLALTWAKEEATRQRELVEAGAKPAWVRPLGGGQVEVPAEIVDWYSEQPEVRAQACDRAVLALLRLGAARRHLLAAEHAAARGRAPLDEAARRRFQAAREEVRTALADVTLSDHAAQADATAFSALLDLGVVDDRIDLVGALLQEAEGLQRQERDEISAAEGEAP